MVVADDALQVSSFAEICDVKKYGDVVINMYQWCGLRERNFCRKCFSMKG